MSASTVWILIACTSLGTFCLRFSFLGLVGRRELPGWVLRMLRYTPVAVIPGLMAPQIFLPSTTATIPEAAKIIAVIVTLAIGVWMKNTVAAMAAGIGVLSVLAAILP